MQIVIAAVIGIAILSFLIIIHELGHFFVARFFGVKVLEFGIGFPFLGRIFKFKRGDTVYSLNWLLFGGFVQLYGEESDSAKGPESFSAKPVWIRYLIAAAGVIVNITFAVIVFTILLATTGFKLEVQSPFANKFPFGTQTNNAIITSIEAKSPAEVAGFKVGDKIVSIDNKKLEGIGGIQSYTDGKVGQSVKVNVENLTDQSVRELHVIPVGSDFGLITAVDPKTPAAVAGLKPFDKIVSIDGQNFTDSIKIRSYIKEKVGQNITMVVQNLDNSSSRTINVTPRKNPPVGQGSLGISLEQGAPIAPGASLAPNTTVAYTSIPEKIFVGFLHSGNMLEFQWAGLKSFISKSVEQKSIEPLASQASGPVRIVAVLGIIVQNSGAEFLKVIATFTALISLMLGIGNLLPIPAVDGGRLFFFLIEGVFRKKINPKIENLIHGVGFVVLLLLLVLITANDVFRIFTGQLFG